MTTDTAQRRLLEALAALYSDPHADPGLAADPLVAIAAGFDFARRLAEQESQRTTAAVFAALIDLTESVHTDLTTQELTS